MPAGLEVGDVLTIIGVAASDQEISCACKGSPSGSLKSVESVLMLVHEFLLNELMIDEFITHTISLRNGESRHHLVRYYSTTEHSDTKTDHH